MTTAAAAAAMAARTTMMTTKMTMMMVMALNMMSKDDRLIWWKDRLARAPVVTIKRASSVACCRFNATYSQVLNSMACL